MSLVNKRCLQISATLEWALHRRHEKLNKCCSAYLSKYGNVICIWKDSPHWPQMQASSSLIPGIRIWSIGLGFKMVAFCGSWRLIRDTGARLGTNNFHCVKFKISALNSTICCTSVVSYFAETEICRPCS